MVVRRAGGNLEASPRRPGGAHDSGIVPAARKCERHLGVGGQLEFKNRSPRCDVIFRRPDEEHWHPAIAQHHGPSRGLGTPLHEIVAEEELARVLTVHAGGKACGVGVPDHHCGCRLTVPKEVVVDDSGPEEVLGAQEL